MLTCKIGEQYKFNYPYFGTPDCYPDHTAHRYETVTVIEISPNESAEECNEYMYVVEAKDGWRGFVWATELESIERCG